MRTEGEQELQSHAIPYCPAAFSGRFPSHYTKLRQPSKSGPSLEMSPLYLYLCEVREAVISFRGNPRQKVNLQTAKHESSSNTGAFSFTLNSRQKSKPTDRKTRVLWQHWGCSEMQEADSELRAICSLYCWS